MFAVFWRILDKLEEICALLDHNNGLQEANGRLLRLLVEEARGGVEFEAEGEGWTDDGEAMTA